MNQFRSGRVTSVRPSAAPQARPAELEISPLLDGAWVSESSVHLIHATEGLCKTAHSRPPPLRRSPPPPATSYCASTARSNGPLPKCSAPTTEAKTPATLDLLFPTANVPRPVSAADLPLAWASPISDGVSPCTHLLAFIHGPVAKHDTRTGPGSSAGWQCIPSPSLEMPSVGTL